eukprot:TRINITY_DN32795_c0_g1_i1.p1 TRINITY_DN32795_c0_g1~~TRINITY_DN32795_c0_g1_i1.p1  ORF type:complete len:134 (-),score=12.62 TRINITY_DN32795_c0_g1_i1:58-423(-)
MRVFSSDPNVQVMLLTTVLVLSIAATLVASPYLSRSLTILDAALMSINFLVLCSAPLFVDENGDATAHSSDTLATIALLTLLISTPFATVIAVYWEGRAAVKNKGCELDLAIDSSEFSTLG